MIWKMSCRCANAVRWLIRGVLAVLVCLLLPSLVGVCGWLGRRQGDRADLRGRRSGGACSLPAPPPLRSRCRTRQIHGRSPPDAQRIGPAIFLIVRRSALFQPRNEMGLHQVQQFGLAGTSGSGRWLGVGPASATPAQRPANAPCSPDCGCPDKSRTPICSPDAQLCLSYGPLPVIVAGSWRSVGLMPSAGRACWIPTLSFRRELPLGAGPNLTI